MDSPNRDKENERRRHGAGNPRCGLLCILLAAVFLTSVEADVVINEFMARNRGAHANATGDDRADWIELHNNGALPVDLTGWHLSDDPFNLAKWSFPAWSIPAGGYLLVYADNATESVTSGELHANFALGTDGETLALVGADGITVVDAIDTYEYSPGLFGYPPQSENISYGRNASGDFSYFDPSTPGAINSGGAADFVADTRFSHDRGFYSDAFDLVISSTTPDASIYYTLNGSEPNTRSTRYTDPIPISRTTSVRARAYKAGLYPTNIDTHTYIFVADVVKQGGRSRDRPPSAEWPASNVNGQVMQYGMDPDVTQDPDYADLVDDALLAIPTISLVTDLDNLFHPGTGIYVNASQEGDLWERVTSVELINPDGTNGFQENAGLRIRGGASRNSAVPKHGFRLRFRREYGAAKLHYPIFGEDGPDASNGVDLRCSQTPGWHYFDGRSVFARDIFARDLQIAQGQPSTRGDKYHLYLNGAYWGMYETQENLEQPFMAENWGGDDEDYDIISKKKHGHTVDGSDAAYRDLYDITMAGFVGRAGIANYFRAQGFESNGVTPNPAFTRLLDVEALTDYMLVHYWTGELDGMAGNWGLNNYICAFNRENPDGFKFFKYDSEWSLDVGFQNNVTRTDTSTDFSRFNALVMHGKLVQNPEYLLAFADQTHKHFFNDGIMTASNALALFTKRTDEIDTAIIGESARWGDAKTTTAPKTRNGNWIPDVNVTRNWISSRTATVLSQLRNAGWYPSLDAPVFSQHGGTFSPGSELSITGPGTVCYTLDGTDPRQIRTGAAQGTVYTGPVPLTHSVVIKARSMTSPTNWSALNEAVFIPDVANTLRISEVMYNPRKPVGAETDNAQTRADFEFIEIHNTGPTEIGLAGIALKGHLGKGVSFDFTGGNVSSVPAMGHVLVVGNLAAFAQRYDTSGLLIAGAFDGKLDDDSDTIELVTSQGELLADFRYADGRDWPVTADGTGHSLVPMISTNQVDNAMEYGANWRASTFLDGSPGTADPAPVNTVLLNEIEAHTDYDNPTPPFDQYDSNDGIELYNITAGAVSMNDWYLSDDADELKKWPIPGATRIDGNSWSWFTEVDDFHNPITSGFGISKSGETIYLSYLPGTAADRVADAVEFEGQANGSTWGRLPDGAGYWQTCVPTNNAANVRGATGLVINEVMYHPAPTSAHPEDNTNDEYIEICNVSGSTVELFNDVLTWRLNGGVDFAFPTGTSLAAGECLAVVSFDPDDPLEADEKAAFLVAYGQFDGETRLLGPYSGKLSNSSDRITLEQPQAPDSPGNPPSWILVDELTYFESAPWPAGTDGTGRPIQRGDTAASGNDPTAWFAADFGSPGLRDAIIATPASAANLAITELFYNPPGSSEATEFVELMNTSDGPVSLLDVEFSEGIEFRFPDLLVLQAGERVLVVADPTEFELAFGTGLPVVGTYTGELKNSGETITLMGPGDTIIASITYGEGPPWPASADPDGHSLTLIAPQDAPDSSQPASWRASLEVGGTPGGSDASTFTGSNFEELLAYAFDGDMNLDASVELLEVDGTSAPYLVITARTKLTADDIHFDLQLSPDLETWSSGTAVYLGNLDPSSPGTRSWRAPIPISEDTPPRFARIVVTVKPLTGGHSFSDWIALFPGVGAQTGNGDDPDGDGVGNGVENFFGTDPSAFSRGLVPGSYDEGLGTFTFTHPQGILADDLSAGYRWSKDLQVFHADGATDADGTKVDFSATTDAGTTTVTATVSEGPAPDKLFVDVEVTQ